MRRQTALVRDALCASGACRVHTAQRPTRLLRSLATGDVPRRHDFINTVTLSRRTSTTESPRVVTVQTGQGDRTAQRDRMAPSANQPGTDERPR
jgi:hypothetical protein